MRFALTFALLAAVLSTSASAGTKAAVGGTLYEVTFHGKGTVTAIGSAPASAQIGFNSSTLTANWTYTAQPVKMWLANVKGTIKESIVTKASAPLTGDGTATADEDFTWYKHEAPQTPLLGHSHCTAPVNVDASAKYEAEASNSGIGFTVDLAGRFHTGQGAILPCDTQSGERGDTQPVPKDSAFQFAWNPEEAQQTATPPYNQRMELVDSLQRFQIGLPSIDLVLKDASQVTNSQNCINLDLTTCNVTFHLTDVELTMRRICSGPLGTEAQTSCGGQGGGTQPTKQPPAGQGHIPPKLTNLKVTPASFPLSATNVRVSYHDDQPGTTTMLQLVGTLYGHEIPLEVFTHLDSTASVSIPLPRNQAAKVLLKPGTFRLEATPTNPKSGRGATATATFVITH